MKPTTISSLQKCKQEKKTLRHHHRLRLQLRKTVCRGRAERDAGGRLAGDDRSGA